MLGRKQSGNTYSEVEIKGLEESMARVVTLMILMYGERNIETAPLARADTSLAAYLPQPVRKATRDQVFTIPAESAPEPAEA